MGQVVADRYRLVAQIGSGGTGTVWKAEDMLLQRVVAVKELRMPPNISPEQYAETTARALAEGRVAARLQHPHIVTVYDVVEHDRRPWIIMQLVAGQSLEQLLAGGAKLPVARAAQIGVELLGAIAAAHEAGVVHRDVKPSNVLIGDDGRVYLTDFSIAKVAGTGTVTNTGVLVGSPGYIAPELIVMGRVAEPADMFGLGATLFRMVEGTGPFDRDEAIAGAFAAAVAPHPRPQSAGELTPVIDGLLAKDPRERLDAVAAMRMLVPLASASAPAASAPADSAAVDQAAPAAAAFAQPAFAAAPADQPTPAAAPLAAASAPAAGAPVAETGFAPTPAQTAGAPLAETGQSFAAASAPTAGAPVTGPFAAGPGNGGNSGGAGPANPGGFAGEGPSTPVLPMSPSPAFAVQGGTDRWRFRPAAAKVTSPTHEMPEVTPARPEPARDRMLPMLAAAAVLIVLVTAGVVYALTRPSSPPSASATPAPSTASTSDSPSPTVSPAPSAAASPTAAPTTPPATQPPPPPKPEPVTVVNRKAPGCGETDSRVVWTAVKAGVACSAAGTTVSKKVGWDQEYMQSYAQLRLSLKNQPMPSSYTVSFTIGGLSGPELVNNRGGCGGIAVHTSANGLTYDYFNVCADGWVETVRVINNVGGDSQSRQLTPGPVVGTSPSYSVVISVNPSATQVTVGNRVGQSVSITAQAAGPSTAYIAMMSIWRNIGATARFSDFTFSAA